ncbi:CBY1-interacting BAR domain-containing protein 1 [Saguinus oedipus]|uniref:CBY1-interacting BAR domain-containing protein 1 n=1 Tax=Saguinus oedipus TaxID=9490 RepID=A0ABQ9UEM7_SAGOE|nr:CBY1-interacting BAR domain-containing protein 1 [Saguinus oedipus]
MMRRTLENRAGCQGEHLARQAASHPRLWVSGPCTVVGSAEAWEAIGRPGRAWRSCHLRPGPPGPGLFLNAQTKQLQTAVSNVEKHFGELCQIFAAYVRKTARLRDKADLLVNEINAYADTETPHLKLGLMSFADEFAKLQDYRQAEVERLEAKVVKPLKAYGTIVKMKRDDLKATFTARNREAKQLTELERTRQRNPSDRHIIVVTAQLKPETT